MSAGRPGLRPDNGGQPLILPGGGAASLLRLAGQFALALGGDAGGQHVGGICASSATTTPGRDNRPGRAAGPPHPSRSGRRARLPSSPSWPGGRRSHRPPGRSAAPRAACRTQLSCTLLPAPTTMGPKSARSTAPYQTLAPAATVTSPTGTAVRATKAPGSITGRHPANSISNAIRPQPSSLGWSGRRRASAVRTPWVPEAGCHAAYLYSWISPPRTSRRRSRPKFGASLASARYDGTGVACAKLRCGRCWL
jgi:hypothetical protein